MDQQTEQLLSYGHINVYSPSLFRFLLKSEGFEIVRDKLSVINREVLEYSVYKSLKRRKTPLSYIKFRPALLARDVGFKLADKKGMEIKANAYTVLCRKTAKSLSILFRA